MGGVGHWLEVMLYGTVACFVPQGSVSWASPLPLGALASVSILDKPGAAQQGAEWGLGSGLACLAHGCLMKTGAKP